jgi:catechol 2,3-dioxygenase-like lactoylglutathione lyase family enzyme
MKMERSVAPMIHVPDVAATVAWYQSLDFEVVDRDEADGELTWAMLSYGAAALMFNAGGRPSSAERREIDLYVTTPGIDALHARLREQVQVIEAPHDTFYGMREFIVRDPNGFWLTFGEPAKQ